jgi:hypothetical protein
MLCLPLWPAWVWLFPKVWLLSILYVLAGSGYWINIRLRPAIAALLLILTVSMLSAWRHQLGYNREPSRTFQAVASQPKSIYASSPAVSRSGVVFESMGAGGYTLNRTFRFEGHAFHPTVPSSGSPIFFELVSKGHSRIMVFNPSTKSLEALTSEDLDATDPAVSPSGNELAFISKGQIFMRGEGMLPSPGPVENVAWFPDEKHLAFSASGAIYDSKDMHPLDLNIAGDLSEPAISPDGKWIALTATNRGIRHIWIENLATRASRELTGGACNSYAPAWEHDSNALIFASDCDRGLGLPRLYRRSL